MAALAAELVTQINANSKSGQIIAFLENEAADTCERAARIEEAAAWRLLNATKAEKFKKAAGQGAGRPTTIGFAVGDPESISLSEQLRDLLSKAQWDVSFVGHWYEGVVVSGIRVLGTDETGRALIQNALTFADLPYSNEPGPIPPMTHSWGVNVPDEIRLFLYVGTKPPPKF